MTQALLIPAGRGAGKAEVQRLIACATRIGRPDKYAGKRKKTRIKGDLWLELRLGGEGTDVIQVTMNDISLGGISFWVRKKIEIGDTVALRDSSDSKKHPWVKVRVTHCVPGLKGFLAGGQYESDC